MASYEIAPLRCPLCGSSTTDSSASRVFGAEFSCAHCGCTSVLIIDQALLPINDLQKAGEKVCTTCGRVALREARFCQEGHSLIRKCFRCSVEFPIDHQRCDSCGILQPTSDNWKTEGKRLMQSGDFRGAFSLVSWGTGEFPLTKEGSDLLESWEYTETEIEDRRRRSEETKCAFCGVEGRPRGADTKQCEKCGRWFCFHCAASQVGDGGTRCKDHPYSAASSKSGCLVLVAVLPLGGTLAFWLLT